MSFADYLFVPLFLILVCVYYLFPQKKRWIPLLVASVCFVCSWGWQMFPWVLMAVGISWTATMAMGRCYQNFDTLQSVDEKARVKRKCKYILWIAVALILGALVFTKTYKFFGELSIVVPLGISYYTMSLVGYMADVYWRKEKVERNPLKLLLFALYFPKILQGPISKHRNVAEQMYGGQPFDYNRFCFGLQRMLWGYFKKLVIADRLSIFIQPIFSEYNQYGGSLYLVAAVLGAFQLYCDFSGCMDIALGASEALGISLEENFHTPFFSKTAAEFWRRWHITLGAWFKDYIYMPLVVSPALIRLSGKIRKKFGKRQGKAFITIIPLGAVWLLTGLWHGTGWNYVVWGVFWGTIIIISNVFEPELKSIPKRLKMDTDSKGYQMFQMLRTFVLFVIARIITMSADLNSAMEVFRRIFTYFCPWSLVDGSMFGIGLTRPDFVVLVLALLLLWRVSRQNAAGIKVREKVASLPIVLRWAIYLAGILAVLVFGIYGPGYDAGRFVYMYY